MRCSFVGLGKVWSPLRARSPGGLPGASRAQRGTSPCTSLPSASPPGSATLRGEGGPLAKNVASPLIYTEEAWFKEDRHWAAIGPLPGGERGRG